MRIIALALTLAGATSAFAQTATPAMPAEYAAVLQTLARQRRAACRSAEDESAGA